jgi:hypothetical protein
MSFSESLEGSTSLLKKSTALSMYALEPDRSFVSDTFYEKINEPFKTKSPEHDECIQAIFTYWIQSKSNVNASQSGYIVFVSKNSPVFVLENTFLSKSPHSYCQVINIDTVVLEQSSKLLYVMGVIIAAAIVLFIFIFLQ